MHWVNGSTYFDIVADKLCITTLRVACGALVCETRWSEMRGEVTCPACLARIEQRGGRG